MPLAPHPTSIVAIGAISLNHGKAGSPTTGFFLNRPAGRKPLTSSFVSAWDLYLEGQSRRIITVIGSSEDRGEVPEPCVCVRVCACVCASPVEDEPQTVPSMIVPVESSQ